MTDRPLLCETSGVVRNVTINDAPWNRMTLAFMDELERLVEETADDDAIRAVVITGARIAPDMFPLSRKVQIASDHAKGILRPLLIP